MKIRDSQKRYLYFSITITIVGLSSSAFAVGIPVVDYGAPIKISESRSFSCDTDGKAMMDNKIIRYKTESVTCKNDNLVAKGKALSFIDLVTDAIYESKKSQDEVE